MKKKFCKGFLALTFTLLCLKIPAQQALKIGETLPESFWTTPLQVVNHPEKTITLDKDRGKLILLDFWATWCSACLKGFPKMEALQKEFGDQIKVLAATDQDRQTIEKFMNTKNGQRFKKIQSVVDDKMFSAFFPHKGIPFIVWIKDGKVLSTTDSEQVTADNIAELLKGKTQVLQAVLQLGRSRPLMLAEQFDLERSAELRHYAFFSKGQIRAIPAGSGMRFKSDPILKKDIIYGRQLTNMPLLKMYKIIADELFGQKGDAYSDKRLILKGVEKNETDDNPYLAGFYSFEFVEPPARAANLYQDMLSALNSYSDYHGVLEKKMTRCLVLIAKNRPGLPPSAQKSHLSVEAFINDLNVDNRITPLSVTDESGYSTDLGISLNEVKDLETLRTILNKKGLDFREAERELLMLVVSKKP